MIFRLTILEFAAASADTFFVILGFEYPGSLLGEMIIGLSAVVFLILFGERQLSELNGYLFEARWTFFRAPLPTATAYAFACHAAALRHSLSKQG